MAIGALLSALFFAALIAYVLSDEDESAVAATQPGAVAEVAQNPGRYYRRTVTLRARIRDVLSPRAVAVGPARRFGVGDGRSPRQLLVVTKRPLAALTGRAAARPLLEGDSVVVRGRLQVLRPAQLEKQLGFELSGEVAARRGQPVLVADEVDIVQRLLPLAGTTGAGAVATRPQRYLGTVASVRGRVTGRGPAGVVLDRRLPVLLPRAARPSIGALVTVTGPVRRLDVDQVRAGGQGLSDELFGRFLNRPVLIGETLAVSL